MKLGDIIYYNGVPFDEYIIKRELKSTDFRYYLDLPFGYGVQILHINKIKWLSYNLDGDEVNDSYVCLVRNSDIWFKGEEIDKYFVTKDKLRDYKIDSII